MLTLRDPQSSKTHPVDPQGAVIGREGGDADITVRNASVSKRHARVFAADGAWWLEDLRSANGTFVGDERLNEPMQMNPGATFALAGYKFEVLDISDEEEPPLDDSAATMAGPGARSAAPPTRAAPLPMTDPEQQPARPVNRAPPPRRPPPRAAKPEPEPEPQDEPPQDEPPQDEAPPEGEQHEEQPQDEAAEPARKAAEEVSGPSSVGDALKELPKAIAYYLVTVPKLLFNPIGTIKKSIEEQKFEGMKGFKLAGWALPGVCTVLLAIVMVIAGAGIGSAIGAIIFGVISAVVGGVVGGLIVAFLYHPVMKFIINLLKGESDEKSRTNYLIIAQAGTILSAIPSGLAVITTGLAVVIHIGVVVALLPIVPSVIQLGATLISIALAYFWMQYFKVHKYVLLAIKIIGVLAILGTAWGLIGSVRFAIASLGSGGSSSVAVAIPKGDKPDKADPDDEDSRDAKPLGPDIKKLAEAAKKDPKKALAEAEKLAAAATEEAEKAIKDAEKAAKDLDKTSEKALKDAEKAEKAAKDAAKAARDAELPKKGPEPKKAVPTPNPEPEAVPEPAPSGQTGYQRFAQHRAFVEKAIEADPTMLKSDPVLLNTYKSLHAKEKDARKNHKGLAADDVAGQRLLEAETYEQTKDIVETLYQRLHK